MHTLPNELLVDLAEGRVAPAEAVALRAHIAADPAARAELRAITGLIGLMRDDDSVDAPEHVINRALRLIRRPSSAPEPGLLQRVVATLRSDSWQRSLAAGFRSGQVWPRAMLLSAGDRDLDLQIVPNGERWLVRGQVLGPEERGRITLDGPAASVSADLSELGEFTLPPVAAGSYTLLLTQGDREIVVPNLELGPSTRPS